MLQVGDFSFFFFLSFFFCFLLLLSLFCLSDAGLRGDGGMRRVGFKLLESVFCQIDAFFAWLCIVGVAALCVFLWLRGNALNEIFKHFGNSCMRFFFSIKHLF